MDHSLYDHELDGIPPDADWVEKREVRDRHEGRDFAEPSEPKADPAAPRRSFEEIIVDAGPAQLFGLSLAAAAIPSIVVASLFLTRHRSEIPPTPEIRSIASALAVPAPAIAPAGPSQVEDLVTLVEENADPLTLDEPMAQAETNLDEGFAGPNVRPPDLQPPNPMPSPAERKAAAARARKAREVSGRWKKARNNAMFLLLDRCIAEEIWRFRNRATDSPPPGFGLAPFGLNPSPFFPASAGPYP